MRCDTFQEWFSLYLGGELGGADRRALEGHLDVCGACAGELETLRGSVRLLRGLLPEDPPEELRPRILMAIAAERRSPWRRLAALLRLPQPAPGWSLAATGLAAALAVGVLVAGPAPSYGPTPVSTAPPVAVAPPTAPLHSAERRPAPPPAAVPAKRVARVTRPAPADRPTQARATRSSTRPTAVVRAPRHSRPPEDPEPQAQAEAHQPTRPVPKTTPRRSAPPVASAAETSEDPRLAPMPPVASAADPEADEPMAMIAAMPKISGDSGMESTLGGSDALASLRRRLAEQRRDMPIPAVDLPTASRAARVLPVRIEF